jgi:hypothetical protein
MSTATLRRPSRAERMERIAEAFRRASPPAAAGRDPLQTGAAASEPASNHQPVSDGSARDAIRQRGWRTEARPSRPGGHGPRADFTHVHRSLAEGESIPRRPSLLEQITGLSELLAKLPLSQQEEAALRGEEAQDLPNDEAGRDDPDMQAEEEEEEEVAV